MCVPLKEGSDDVSLESFSLWYRNNPLSEPVMAGLGLLMLADLHPRTIRPFIHLCRFIRASAWSDGAILLTLRTISVG